MTDREKELLAAARKAYAALDALAPELTCTDELAAALLPYLTPPPVTSDPGFDGRDGGRMNINSIGADDGT